MAHKHNWYFLSGSVIFCKCFEALPISEAEVLLNSAHQLEADNATLQQQGKRLYKLLHAGFRVVNVGGHLNKQWLLEVKEALEAEFGPKLTRK